MRKSVSHLSPIAFLGFAIAVAAAAPAPIIVDVGEQVYKPSREVVTPHIPWAVPYAKGKLRVLFLDIHGKAREAVEFAQRLDMDFAFFGFNGSSCGMTPYYLRGGYYKGDAPGDKEKRLKALLASDYDLIVMGNISWPGLPDFAKKAIADQVQRGAGLVRLATGNQGEKSDDALNAMLTTPLATPLFIAESFPWKSLPVFQEYQDNRDFLGHCLKAYRHGKGAVVNLYGYQPCDDQILSPGFAKNTLWHRWYMWWVKDGLYKEKHPELTCPIADIKPLDYDYYLEFLIQVMLFAARRSPDIAIVDDGAARRYDREAFSELTFKLEARQAMDGLDAEAVIRDRDNDVLFRGREQNIFFSKGRGAARFRLPPLPAGHYFADLWVRRNGAVEGFGSIAIEIAGDARIVSAALGKDHYGKNDRVSGEAIVDVGKKDRDDLSCRLRWKDSLGRLVQERKIAIDDAKVPFDLGPAKGPVAVRQFLELDLMKDDQVLDRKKPTFTYDDLYLDDAIRLGAWKWARMSYSQYHYYQRLYDIGFDSVGCFYYNENAAYDNFGVGPNATTLTGRYEMATLANLRYMPPLLRVTDMAMYAKETPLFLDAEKTEPVQTRDNERTPCVNDPSYVGPAKARVAAMVAHYKKGSTREYFFDQEPCFAQPWHRDGQDLCHCPRCQNFFRDFLKGTYRTPDALNAEWGTAFKSFDDVHSVTFARAAKDRKLGPQWLDFQLAMGDAFNGFYRDLTEAAQRVQPNARTGDSAPIYQGFRSGEAVDIWKFSRWTKVSAPYPTLTEPIRADFALPDALINRGVWWGPARHRGKTFSVWHPWNDLFEGSNFWYCYYGDTASLLAYDLSLFDDLKVRMGQLLEIKNGVGRLLHGAKRGDSGVAILYSISSVHAWALTEAWNDTAATTKTSGKVHSSAYRYNVGAWMALLKDTVGPFRFISYEQLENGLLEKDRFGMLVLPLCQALSPEQARRTAIFAENGGTVVADLRPGVWDTHGKPYAVSTLDALFGVRQNAADGKIRRGQIRAKQGNAALSIDAIRDETLVANGGAVRGETPDAPTLIENRYGKGRGVLLNFSVADYLDTPSLEWSEAGYRSAAAPAMAAFFRELFRPAALDRPFAIAPDLWGLHNYYYRDGDALYIGLLRDFPGRWEDYAALPQPPSIEKKIVITLAKPAWVYDLRERRPLGHTDKPEVFIRTGEAKILSVLPYEVRGVELDAPEHVRQGETLAFRANIVASTRPGNHVLRVELVNPEGAVLRHYSTDRSCPNGALDGEIRLALNEKIGVYVLRARDIATGAETKKLVQIIGEQPSNIEGTAP